MKLTLITENVDKMIQVISQRDKIEPAKIKEIITTYSPNPKYSQFILRQWYTHNIRLPEDGSRVKETLDNFDVVKGKLQNKDLLSYKSLNDLENAIEPYIGTTSKRQGGSDIVDPTKLEGVELIKRSGPYRSYIITDVDSLKELGEGTKWCTRGSYPNCMADSYLDDNQWIGQIWQGNKPIIQYTPDYDQVMDRNDNDIDINDYDKSIVEAFVVPDGNDTSSLVTYCKVLEIRSKSIERIILKSALDACEYAVDIIGGRWPEAEPTIIKNPNAAYKYAIDIIGGRWPEAEPTIAKDPNAACLYAINIIHGRWPEAEDEILSDLHATYAYTRDVLKSRWPEAEPIIIESPSTAVSYAIDIIGGRWPEAEPIITKDARAAYKYARDILNRRWPEAEPTILTDSDAILGYVTDVIEDRWPEAEPIINKNSYAKRTYYNLLDKFIRHRNKRDGLL